MTTATLVIRPFQATDLPVLVALEETSVGNEERRLHADFEFAQSTVRELILTAVLDGDIVGYVGFTMPSPPFCLSVGLERIVVRTDRRRRGTKGRACQGMSSITE